MGKCTIEQQGAAALYSWGGEAEAGRRDMGGWLDAATLYGNARGGTVGEQVGILHAMQIGSVGPFVLDAPRNSSLQRLNFAQSRSEPCRNEFMKAIHPQPSRRQSHTGSCMVPSILPSCLRSVK